MVASSAGLGLVPHRVGPGVQWQVYPAERPSRPTSPYDAERALNEAVIDAAALLRRLDVAAGPRPRLGPSTAARPRLQQPPALHGRTSRRLLAACDAALSDDGASISSYEAGQRAAELRRVRARAGDALGSAVSWPR